MIERCLELGTRYAKQRVTFGQPLAERQAVQWMLVDSFMELHQLRLMVYDAAWKYDQGRDIRTEAYMAKIFGDTQSFHAADRCMEIHGGMGLATDLPIEKFWRDQRSMMITEGPIEILKMTLGAARAAHVRVTEMRAHGPSQSPTKGETHGRLQIRVREGPRSTTASPGRCSTARTSATP